MRYDLSEITAVIRDRRTIFPEAFSSRQVHREQVEHILQNATWAPTHGKTQPWRFVVFMDQARQRLANFLGEYYRANTPEESFSQAKLDRLTQRPLMASVVVAVYMSREADGKISEMEEMEAVACAIQNMHLTCTAYGLGAFWSTGGGVYSADFARWMNLSESERMVGLVYIGYPEGEWPKSHRKPLEYVTRWENE